MCWYLWLVIIFYSLQKYFPFFSFLFSPSPLTLGFRDIWPDILLPLSVCLSLSHTHSVSHSTLTPSPDLKLLRVVFLPSYITCNQQRALDYLKWWRFILKTLQKKERKSPQEVRRLSSSQPGFTKTWNTDSPGLPEAALMPTLSCCTRLSGQGLFSTLVMTQLLFDSFCFTLDS